MRKHLIKCFEQKNIEPFPVIKERRMSIYPKTITIKVYCYCRSVYDGQKMVECNGVCGEWYHTKCISTVSRSGSVRTVVYYGIWHS